MPTNDFRARLQPKPSSSGGNTQANTGKQVSDVLGPRTPENILYPLWSTNGVLFPYTPTVSTGSVAEYDPSTFVHTNYGYNAYIRSYPKNISISAKFTAQTNDEALYLLAVLHFFKSVTKSYFGVTPYDKAGTPPPVLIFNYLGQYMFNNVPVIVKSFDYTLSDTVDYVSVYTGSPDNQYSSNIQVNLPAESNGGYTYVPTMIDVTVELDTQYTPLTMRKEFNLDKFRSGHLYGKGKGYI